MKITFVDTTDQIAYLEPETDIVKYLGYIQDGIESEGIQVIRNTKIVNKKVCKFCIDFQVNDVDLLQKRKNLISKKDFKPDKMNFVYTNEMYVLEIGTIDKKEINIVIAKFNGELSELEQEAIENVRETVTEMFKPTEEKPAVKFVAPQVQPPPQVLQPLQPSHSQQSPFKTSFICNTKPHTRELRSGLHFRVSGGDFQ
jgi:hypothetical protein